VARERDCELELRDGSGVRHVTASAADVAVMLDNLLENAIEHTAPGTTVTVELRVDGEWARVAVDDDGPGLQAGEEQRVFERFVRGSSRGDRPSGSGLGLTIVRALARRWGGEATIASRPQGGARAEIRLPAAPIDGRDDARRPDEALAKEA
jgi:two-component system, OmpR family, sensor kinase